MTLPIVLVVACMCLELVHRAHLEVVLQHGVFLYTRARALGGSYENSKALVREFWREAFGKKGTATIMRRSEIWEDRVSGGLRGKIHIRYPSLMNFEYDSRKGKCVKSHFEITRSCTFPF